MALELYYSSGSDVLDSYTGEPRKSIGGYQTSTKVPDNTLKALFGTVSQKMIFDGRTDYRMVYLKTTINITALDLYVDRPDVSPELNPADLTPNDGDQYIIPEGATGVWEGRDGRLATYVAATGLWTITFAPFAKYEFAFVSPTDKVDDPLTGKFVNKTENVFQPPSGLAFVSLDGVGNKDTIGSGTYSANDVIGVWIKRTITSTTFTVDDLVLNEGGIVLNEQVTLKFSYDDGTP